MKEKFLSFIDSVKTMWNKTSKKMRIVFLSITAAILAISLIAVILLNNTNYVVLYQGMSTSDNAEIIAQIQEMGVDAVLDGDKLLVPKESEDMVRMQLATRGYQSSVLGYDTYQNGAGLTSTQQQQQQWTVYQLQDRLQATIETFPEVNRAIVNISMPEKNGFVLESQVVEPTASVKLEVRNGRKLTTEQIQGIVNIVKNSVPGLKEENISVADGTGDLLGSLIGGKDAASTKLALTEQVNDTVQRRVMTMLVPIFGDGNVVVAVNSVLDTDRRVTEETAYNPLDPENPVNNPLDFVEVDWEKAGGTAPAGGVPGADPNTDVPNYGAFQNEAEGSDYYYAHEVYNYLVGSVKSQIVSEGLDITDMTVAVIVDSNAMAAGQRDQIIDLVATTAGIPRDKVSVQVMEFHPVEESTSGSLFDPGRPFPIIPVIALGLAAIVLALMLILFLRRKQQEKLALEQSYMMDDTPLVDLMFQQDEDFEPIAIPETSEQKLKAQIKDLASSDPEIVAQLIKTWLINA